MKKTRAEQFKEIAEKYHNNRPGFNCQFGGIRVTIADHGGLSIRTPINAIHIYASDIPALYEFIKDNMIEIRSTKLGGDNFGLDCDWCLHNW